ncbi:transcriptional regulator [Naasia sp. SYSU D00057]|uniref:winged helix-turn-helix domain-containing protein n=1 Tax=Naasia sp. SYSU D00057 TaxID=2817380 RepID=UPI0027DD8669|nr:transcriptional regulator [Naasia sp. SYSU D00057]
MPAEPEERHPRHALDPLIHQPVRFSILAMLAAADEVQFAMLRDVVEVTDSVLSKQLALLEQSGLVAVRKEFAGKYPRTWVRLTESGRTGYDAHLAALRAIVAAPPEAR